MMTDRELEDYVKARDNAVSSSLDEFITWAEGRVRFSSREAAEISLHKMRTSITTLPHDMRIASHNWLRERGFTSWLDPC